jgi:hypothetical protein
MLIRLIHVIAEAGGSTNQLELAHKLDVSAELVATMINDLVRLGYLSEVHGGCNEGACSGCSAHKADACSMPSKATLWSLTPAGRSAALKTG